MAKAAAEHADAVDREARFPREAFAIAKTERLLGTLLPQSFGGDGASIGDVADICYRLGRACASTGMIFAMHQIMVAILMRHAGASEWHRQFLRRLGEQQLLLASSTTEGQGGGDLRVSACAVTAKGAGGIELSKQATVMSFGAHADGILTTARRSPDADPSDQVLVALVKENYVLDPILEWDTMGMRGTCSAGFSLKAEGDAAQVFPDAYAKIHAASMTPIAHLTWSSVWAGIAADAVARARRFSRQAARRSAQMSPSAVHLTRATMSLQALRALIASSIEAFEAADRENALESIELQTKMNLLKVQASELAADTVFKALQVCGLAGYRNSGEFTVGRHLRDVLSSAVMINNDRIVFNATRAALLVDVPSSLRS